jgi:hypothetical protein
MEKIFWSSTLKPDCGELKGGLFIRSDIGKEIKRIEDENGLNIVAIKVDPDGGWNTEFIVEEKPSAEIIKLVT